MRKAVVLALSLAIQAAALAAPLVHAHPDDHATAHHDGGTVHAHWAGHAHPDDHGAALERDNHDRAVFLNAFVAVSAASFAAPALTAASFELTVPRETAAHQPVEVVRSHDPPFFCSLSPRAPPAFLS